MQRWHEWLVFAKIPLAYNVWVSYCLQLSCGFVRQTSPGIRDLVKHPVCLFDGESVIGWAENSLQACIELLFIQNRLLIAHSYISKILIPGYIFYISTLYEQDNSRYHWVNAVREKMEWWIYKTLISSDINLSNTSRKGWDDVSEGIHLL